MTAARRLVAILAADVVGYSRMMGEDEAGTAEAVRERREAAAPTVRSLGGRLVKTMGDGVLLEFPSVVAAVECAIAIQTMMADRNAGLPEAKRILYRVGVNLGDILIDGEDILGDGVNIAARLEGIAAPGGICLSEDAWRQVRDKMKETFVDLGEKNLKNIARPVRVYALQTASAEAARPAPPTPAVAPDKSGPPRLSIVVLPFANLGGDPEQEYFVDGVTESLTTDLSKIRGSFVIARNTAFTFKGKPYDVKAIGRELNVRYALEGSVQRGGGRMRINVQLIDAESGHHLWAERFDKPIADLFDMQDEIVARLADQIGAHLVIAEARRAERSLNPDSMDLYFQGRVWVNKGVSSEYLAKARDCFERAAALDPANLAALHGVAQVDALLAVAYLAPDRAARFKAAEETTIRLLRQEPDNPRLHFTLGVVLAYTDRVPQGIAEFERALALDPNLAGAHGQIGNAKNVLGYPEEAEGHVLEAMRLSPRDTASYGWAQFIGNARLALGESEEAVIWFRRSIEMNGAYAMARIFLAVALADLGRIEEARNEVRIGLDLGSHFTIRQYRDSRPTNYNPAYLNRRAEIIELMGKVGLPEG